MYMTFRDKSGRCVEVVRSIKLIMEDTKLCWLLVIIKCSMFLTCCAVIHWMYLLLTTFGWHETCYLCWGVSVYHVLFYWGWFCQCVHSGCQEESPPPKRERERERERESEINTLICSVMTLAVIFCKLFSLRQTSCLVQNMRLNLTGFIFMGSF